MRITSLLLASALLASVAVAQRGPATSAVFTNFGTPCGADLNGTVGTNLEIGLAVTNAPASTFGFIAIGDQATTPHPLPVGNCSLLIDARHHRLHSRMFRTDANGAASIQITRRTPPAGLTVSFQAVVVSHDRVNRTRSMAASNGTELVTQ